MSHNPLPRLCRVGRMPLFLAAMGGRQGTQLQGIPETLSNGESVMVPALIMDEDLLLNTDFHQAQCASWVREFNQSILGGDAMVFVLIHKTTPRFLDGILQLTDELLDLAENTYDVGILISGFATGSQEVEQRLATWGRLEDMDIFDTERFKRWIANHYGRLPTQAPMTRCLNCLKERKAV